MRPMIFSDDRAYRQLRDEGIVYTARAQEKPDCGVWIRRSRTGEKDDEVPHARRELIESMPPKKFKTFTEMRGTDRSGRYTCGAKCYERAGFDSPEEWLDAIREQNGGELPSEIYVYRVVAKDLEETQE